ncbi:MAG: hypothetical protein ACMUIG_05425 [Thermoplasmatota archaeon]
MKKHIFAIMAIAGVLALMSVVISGQVNAEKKQTTELYYEGELVTALIPNGGNVNFKEIPENSRAYPFDPIYVFVDEDTMMPHAQNPLIGSVPGDSEYTGGRWQVFLVFGTSAEDDDITSVYDLMMSDLEIEETNMYFSCPVIGR